MFESWGNLVTVLYTAGFTLMFILIMINELLED